MLNNMINKMYMEKWLKTKPNNWWIEMIFRSGLSLIVWILRGTSIEAQGPSGLTQRQHSVNSFSIFWQQGTQRILSMKSPDLQVIQSLASGPEHVEQDEWHNSHFFIWFIKWPSRQRKQVPFTRVEFLKQDLHSKCEGPLQVSHE